MEEIFRALRSRNYRLYFIGQGISLIGTWMQRVSTAWLVYRLTYSPFFLGVAEFAGQFSAFLLMPFAGVLLDRWDLRRALIITQVLALVQSLILAILTMNGSITFGQVILLCIFQGVVNAFDMPGRQSFVIQMVDRKEDLGNAIALNSTIFNLARLVGPSIAGFAIGIWGEGFCFLLNSISFIPVILALFAIVPRKVSVKGRHSLMDGVKEGLSYAFNNNFIRVLLLELSLISLMGMPYVVLMPVVAKEILGGDASTLGLLMGGSGIGALLGALFVASRKEVTGIEKLIPPAFLGFGIGFVIFSQSRFLVLSIILMAFNGFAMIVGWASSNTVLQSIVSEEKRSRIMSLYIMSFTGTSPIGSLIAGSTATYIGVSPTLFLCGAACFFGTLFLMGGIYSISTSADEKPSQIVVVSR